MQRTKLKAQNKIMRKLNRIVLIACNKLLIMY